MNIGAIQIFIYINRIAVPTATVTYHFITLVVNKVIGITIFAFDNKFLSQ